MGQRHQAFIIARVVPHGEQQPRYRSIGAIHHQWCYGRLPLRAASRFMTLIKQKDNAEVIREEIFSIHGLYGRFRMKPKISDVPCPFSQFLLSSAWSADLADPSDGYASETADLSAAMGSTEGDNNDGITVIDVTDPEHPAYCFVSIDHLEGKNDNVPQMTPLSATQYVRVYYPEPEDSLSDEKILRGPDGMVSPAERARLVEESVQSAIHLFDSIPVVAVHKLAEAWPREYGTQDIVSVETVSDTTQNKVPSLVGLTLRPAVEQAILANDIGQLDPLIFHRDNAAIMREVIRSQNPIPEAGVSLLKMIIEVQKNNTLDLSGFNLSGKQIISLLTFQQENNKAQELDIEVLKLSHNNQVDIEVVQQVLEISTLPALRRLVLWNTAISDDDIIGLLGKHPKLFYRIEGLIHSAFMKSPSEDIYPAAFVHINCNELNQAAKASIPYFTSGQIAQGLFEYLNFFQHNAINSGYHTPIMAAHGSEVRLLGKPWSERIVPFVPSYSLKGINEGPGWIFAFSPLRYGSKPGVTSGYAFARINTKATKELADEHKKTLPGNEPVNNITEALEGEYRSRVYDLYDVQAFFKELELEGRPAPKAETLARLFELFKVFGAMEGFQALNLMTTDLFVEFMARVEFTDRLRLAWS